MAQKVELLGILLASLAGSFHCVSMCGGLALSVTNGSALSQAGYHGGRVVSYTLLGALAGGAGSALLDKLALPGLRGLALALFAFAILMTTYQTWRGQMHTLPGMSGLRRLTSGFLPAFMKSGPFGAGLATALIPCGWLYGFVLLAAGGGGALRGAMILLVFSLGTVPVFSAGSWGLRRVLQSDSVRLRKGIAIGIFLVGMASLWGRVSEFPAARADRSVPSTLNSMHSCH